MTRITSLAAVLLLLAASTPARGQGALDSLTCYKPRDQAPRGKFTLVNGSQACTFRTPARLACVATPGGSITPAPGGTAGAVNADLLCYRAKCVGTNRGTSREFRDAVGNRPVMLRAGKFVCLPANQVQDGGPTTTTVVTPPTTSTTIGAQDCGFSDGQCSGACPPGQTCGAAVGTGSCECRTSSCGDADAPTCDGACPDPEEACVFVLTGCECVGF